MTQTTEQPSNAESGDSSRSSHCSHASPVYDRDSIRIFHSDCEAIIGTPITKGIKIVVTSPPYNLGAEPWPHLGHWKPGDAGAGSKSKWRNGSDACNGIQYAEHADTMPWDDYCRWQRRVLTKLWKFLPDDGAIFYNHKPRVIGGRLWLPLELLPMGVTLRQIIIWARPGGMNFNPTAFVPTHEWIMVIAKEHFRLKSRGASGLGDVWQMTPERNKHPAPFPVALPSRVIDATGTDAVFDPFCGSGTTMLAAKLAGVRGVGCDVSREYVDQAIGRLAQGVLF